MKTRTTFILSILLFAAAAVWGQSVVVSGKKMTYKRPDPIGEHKRTFTINHPKVRASTSALSRKIENEISHEKVFGFTVREELREIQWLENADFEVLYNKNGLLCVGLFIEGSGAYPDGSTKRVVVDTRTGKRVLPGEVFVYFNNLVEMVRKVQKKEIADAIKEIKSNKEWEEPDPEALFENKVFMRDDLKGFSITEKGVTFYYDYGFPHVIQAMEPNGEYSFTWAEMKPYIRINGALGRMTR